MSELGMRVPENGAQYVSKTSGSDQLLHSYAPMATSNHNNIRGLEEEFDDMDVLDITDQDAQSLMELSLGQAATRIKSAMTPAAEKAAAMDQLDDGGYFDSDTETPPAEYYADTDSGQRSPMDEAGKPVEETKSPFIGKENAGLSLGRLPSPKLENPGIPITPWHVGPKTMVVQPNGGAHPSIAGAFSNSRNRSMSGGADSLKKFLGLPSLSQVGHMFGGNHKSKAANSPTKDSFSSHSKNSPAPSPLNGTASRPQFQTIVHTSTQPVNAENVSKRPPALRRSTSENSMLYHSLSRASSLGDDARFENHRQQVNSRAKAIRDSLQDRSSFRMPAIPSLPSMPRMPSVSSFSFNMNFLTSSNNVPARWRSDSVTNGSDILPGTIVKKKPHCILGANPNPVVAPGVVSAAATQPRTTIAVSRSNSDTQQTGHLDRAMENLTGDVVILGGYRGSILRSTQTNRRVWVPVKVGLNIRKVDLEVGLEPEDEEKMRETIYPSGMLQNIGPIDVSKRLFTRLSECENARNGKLTVWDYGYDWRLSPALLSKQFTAFLENLPSSRKSADGTTAGKGAVVIAHSLGGLITRHVVNHRPDLFAGVIYAGVPQACVNILGPLRNGDVVLFSQRVLTAQVNFTLRTSFVLLPEDGGCFVDINTKEKYPVNFFDINDWIKYRLSPCIDPPLPPRNHPAPSGLGVLLAKPGSLLNLSSAGRKSSIQSDGAISRPRTPNSSSKATRAADTIKGAADSGDTDRTIGFEMGSNSNPVNHGQSINSSVSTAVTIPRQKALVYLERTLAETIKFKRELHFKPELSQANHYPPLAVIYGKNTPTCYGAKVDGKEGIPCSDSYENLAFASGDGVCLAKEAMLPVGYELVSNGRISSDRGHITLLGDLNAVGRALEAVILGRKKGIGLGGVRESG